MPLVLCMFAKFNECAHCFCHIAVEIHWFIRVTLSHLFNPSVRYSQSYRFVATRNIANPSLVYIKQSPFLSVGSWHKEWAERQWLTPNHLPK